MTWTFLYPANGQGEFVRCTYVCMVQPVITCNISVANLFIILLDVGPSRECTDCRANDEDERGKEDIIPPTMLRGQCITLCLVTPVCSGILLFRNLKWNRPCKGRLLFYLSYVFCSPVWTLFFNFYRIWLKMTSSMLLGVHTMITRSSLIWI